MRGLITIRFRHAGGHQLIVRALRRAPGRGAPPRRAVRVFHSARSTVANSASIRPVEGRALRQEVLAADGGLVEAAVAGNDRLVCGVVREALAEDRQLEVGHRGGVDRELARVAPELADLAAQARQGRREAVVLEVG